MDSARLVRLENIKHFLWLLDRAGDENERKTALRLLAQEQAKQIAAGDPPDDRYGQQDGPFRVVSSAGFGG